MTMNVTNHELGLSTEVGFLLQCDYYFLTLLSDVSFHNFFYYKFSSLHSTDRRHWRDSLLFIQRSRQLLRLRAE